MLLVETCCYRTDGGIPRIVACSSMKEQRVATFVGELCPLRECLGLGDIDQQLRWWEVQTAVQKLVRNFLVCVRGEVAQTAGSKQPEESE